MKEKKQAANWYVAFTHFLTSGFAIPFLVGGLLVLLFWKFPSLEIGWLQYLIGLAVIWLGVLYSARYINKKYLIKDRDRVIILSTVYFSFWLVILALPGGIVSVVKTFSGKIPWEIILNSIIIPIVQIVLFYVFSKKYIGDSMETNETH